MEWLSLTNINGAAWWVVVAIQAIYAVLLSRMKEKFVGVDDHAELRKLVNKLSDDVLENNMKTAFIEKTISQLPTAEDIHQLSIQINNFRGDMSATIVRFEAFNDSIRRLQLQVDRMDTFLKE